MNEIVAALPADDFRIGAVLTLTISGGGFYYGFRPLRRSRIIEEASACFQNIVIPRNIRSPNISFMFTARFMG